MKFFKTPTDTSIRSLIDGMRELCVSIYLPVPERPGFGDLRRLPARYEGLSRNVAERLEELRVASLPRSDVMRELERVDVEFTALPPGTRSVAVFASPGRLETFALAGRAQASFYVGRTPHIRPLLACAQLECRFRVLSLCTNKVELFEGDAHSLERVDRGDVPGSLEEALGSELSEGTLQLHSSASGGRAPIFHGHGGADRARNVDRDRFHRALAGALRRTWGASSRPIVLAADRANDGRFRKVARLPALLSERVIGNPSHWTDEQLHELTAGVVRRWNAGRRQRELADARRALTPNRAQTDLPYAALAVVSGRVERLLVSERARAAHHVDPREGLLLQAFGDEDALDELCALAIARGGRAVVLDDDQLTETSDFIAELRG